MKLLALAALIAVVSSGPLSEPQPSHPQQWPWQTGKQYRYEVNSHTVTHFQEGPSSGSAFKAHFIIYVKAPGQLQAKLENPQHAQFHQQLDNRKQLPADLKYTGVKNLDQPFEIFVDGGRVLLLNLPSTLSVSNENLLKGLISALQVDLTSYRHINRPQDNYDKNSQQGLFSKLETDVTGNCETLYTVSPVNAEWKQELTQFASDQEPIEITKSRSHDHCHHDVGYQFGVPRGAKWTGTAHRNSETQFISRGSRSRILAGTQGPIYKAETNSSVSVHPHIYGKQKAEVYTFLLLLLKSVEEIPPVEWQKPEKTRQVKSLMFSLSTKQVLNNHESSSQSNEEFEGPRNTAQELHEIHDEYANIHNYHDSSSSSDWFMNSVNDQLPKSNEPAHAALFLNSQSHVDKKQNAMNAQKVLQDLAQQLQTPNNMPKDEFLTKFNILVRLISAMTTDQLTQLSRSIELGKASNNIVKVGMWMIYRDAVVQAGTLPAFQQVKTWITTKTIEAYEAAVVMSSLAKSLRYPTKNIMKQFFELALTPEVQEQRYLNASALIAATKFIRMGYVDYENANSYYPIYMYGRFTPKQDRFVVEDILPRLSELLKHAVEQGECSKAQVIVKAIGTLGHRDILKVFTPYLEGQIKVSTYVRVQMIIELKPLAEQRDRYVLAVLYSILRNTAEPYEVRVAAAFNIFRHDPTADMWFVMAQMTYDDPSIHVRAALKSGIEAAANLEGDRHRHLARSAQAVRNLVTSEHLGYAYSAAVYFERNVDSEEVPRYRSETYIGSDKGLIPKLYKLIWSNRFYGRGAENTMGFAVSSAQELINYIKQLILEPRKSTTEHQYSADKTSDLLNIKRDPREPIESSIYYKIFDQELFLTFDEEDIKQIIYDIIGSAKKLGSGIQWHYTKVFYSKQVSVMFPLATGMPFVYEYKEPVLVHVQSKISGKINHPPAYKNISATLEKELKFTFAGNMDGNVGFIDTVTDQLARTGVVKKYQINLPVKIAITVQNPKTEIKIEPLDRNEDITLAYFRVWLYSALQKKDTIVPPSQDPTTITIKRPYEVTNKMNFKIGQKMNTIIQVEGYSYSKSYSHTGSLEQDIPNLPNLLSPNDLADTCYVYKYLGKQSKTEAVKFTVVFDELWNQNQLGEFGQADKFSDVTADSAPRREEILKRVSTGINTARAQVVDLSASFEGPQKQVYSLTAAYAESLIDTKLHGALFLGSSSAQHGDEQINAVVKIQTPQMTPLNYQEALKRDVNYNYEVDVRYGQNSNINLKGHTKRSQQYLQYLNNSHWANQCAQENAQQNLFQPDCHDILLKSQVPDQFRASVTYKNLSPLENAVALQAYTYILRQVNAAIEYNPLKKTAEGLIELEANASYVDQTANVAMTSFNGHVHLTNLPMVRSSYDWLTAVRPLGVISSWNHALNSISNHRYQAYCTVDGTKMKTFSGLTYNFNLTQSWAVAMHKQAIKTEGEWKDLVVAVKRIAERNLNLYISHTTDTGIDLEINIPYTAAKNKASVNVKTNAKKIADGQLVIYWDDVAAEPVLQYSITSDVLLLHIRDDLHFMFDGERVILTTSEYRNTTRGICGYNSGEPRDDYRTPFGIVDNPEHRVASFVLDPDQTDSKIQELKKLAQQSAYPPTVKYTTILRSDDEWKKDVGQKSPGWGSQKVYRTMSYLKQRGPCQVQNQVQYHENHGEICITTTALSACQSHCHGNDYQGQAVQAVCKSKTDAQFKMYKNQILQGQNPQVTGVPKVEQYRVPTTCTE